MADDFNPVLHIDSDGRIVPAGPCDIIAGEKVTKLYAWVVQANHDGTAAICSGFQEDFPHPGKWVARADAYRAGKFQPGQALGTAVIIRRSESLAAQGEESENPKVHWWSSTVVLQKAAVS
jgi:hypothetical protein